jgi:hypothetical protein
MITQDSIRFYKSHGVYKQFGGVVLASEEGERIADALGRLPFPFPFLYSPRIPNPPNPHPYTSRQA